jgi:hypothetical protein
LIIGDRTGRMKHEAAMHAGLADDPNFGVEDGSIHAGGRPHDRDDRLVDDCVFGGKERARYCQDHEQRDAGLHGGAPFFCRFSARAAEVQWRRLRGRVIVQTSCYGRTNRYR